MANTLLPPNTTPLERNLSRTMAGIEDIPVPIRDLWNPDKCPEPWLPFLAWQFSVDRWDSSWSVETKRAVIKASFFVHQKKGTIGAIRRAVEPLGFLIRVLEWWQMEPNGEAGTFQLDVGVLDLGITEEMYAELERLIDDAKPCSRHLTGLAISMETRGSNRIFVGAHTGETTTVYAYAPGAIETTGNSLTGGAMHTVDTMNIHPLN